MKGSSHETDSSHRTELNKIFKFSSYRHARLPHHRIQPICQLTRYQWNSEAWRRLAVSSSSIFNHRTESNMQRQSGSCSVSLPLTPIVLLLFNAVQWLANSSALNF